MKNRTWFLLMLNMLLNSVYSQNLVCVKGDVNVPYAHIKLLNSNFVTTTDENGDFSIAAVNLNTINGLFFTAVGYNDTTVFFKAVNILNDTIFLKIALSKKDYLLNEVSIYANRYFFESNNSILDIEFVPGNKFILLQAAASKSLLSIIDSTATVLKSIYLKNRFSNFHFDCFNNIDLISKDICMQLFIDGNDIYVVDSFPYKAFNEKLFPMLFKINSYYILRLPIANDKKYVNKFNNKMVNFYLVPNQNNKYDKREIIYSYFDEESAAVANSYLLEIFSLYNATTTPKNQNDIKMGMWDGNIIKLLNGNHKLHRLISWYLNFETLPVLVKAFKQNNRLFFVNLSNSKIIKYDETLALADTIDLQTNQKDYKDVIQDRSTEDIYLVYDTKGIYYLGKIDLKTGKLGNPVKACAKPFPKVFKINDNYSYCVYYDREKHYSYILRKPLTIEK